MKPALVLCGLLLSTQAAAADLSGVKTYLGRALTGQVASTAALKEAANRYYASAKATGFDYAALARQPATRLTLQAARSAWQRASPAYEDIEGIVAGVDALSEFDVILDAGTSAADSAADAVPFDLKLPSGRVLPRPGNLFGVTEGSLWGTVRAFSSGVPLDVNGNGRMDFGDSLPDANVLKAAADLLHGESLRLQKAAVAWRPSTGEVFGALVGNVPTVGPVFFEDWKSSPFVLGSRSTRTDFVVISRLSDLTGNVSSWQAMYRGLSPEVRAKNAALDAQISGSLNELGTFVGRLVQRETTRRYTPEQAEQLQREAQNRATLITGKITQAAALLGVRLE